MSFPYITPALGIINEQDRACAEMLTIVLGKPDKLLWSYVKRERAAKWIPFDTEACTFTPLSHFQCMAAFKPAGQLSIIQYDRRSRARYPGGRLREWQGKQQETIVVHPDVLRYVHDVLAEEESRRAKDNEAVAS